MIYRLLSYFCIPYCLIFILLIIFTFTFQKPSWLMESYLTFFFSFCLCFKGKSRTLCRLQYWIFFTFFFHNFNYQTVFLCFNPFCIEISTCYDDPISFCTMKIFHFRKVVTEESSFLLVWSWYLCQKPADHKCKIISKISCALLFCVSIFLPVSCTLIIVAL